MVFTYVCSKNGITYVSNFFRYKKVKHIQNGLKIKKSYFDNFKFNIFHFANFLMFFTQHI